MTATETVSQRVLDHMPHPEKGEKNSIILALTIIVAIVKLVITIYACWKSGNATESLAHCRKPNLLQRWMLRRIVKRVLTKEGFPDQVRPTCKALLKVGRTLTIDELAAVIEETWKDETVHAMAERYGLT